MDELIDHAKRHHQARLTINFDPHYPLGPGCTVRAVTFGDPPSMPILVPQGQIPVMNAEGTEVTLQRVDGDGCSECGTSPKVMRQITDHIVDGDSANHQLAIEVTDEPGAGGANHCYTVAHDGHTAFFFHIDFQNGPIKEFGVNGLTQEALIAICIDRLRSFQAGPFACAANGHALENLEQALFYLQTRTRERIARGVEGTHTK